MARKVWGQSEAEPEEAQEPKAVAGKPATHVHSWTKISPRKRKCKSCGAVEVSE